VYSGTIQNQKEQLEELGARVKKVETRQDAPPPVDSKVANADFYNRPMEMVTEIVRKEVAAAIEPLTTFVRTAGARDEYSTGNGSHSSCWVYHFPLLSSRGGWRW